jgi:hypothetical protein
MPAHSSTTPVRARAPLPRDVSWTWLDLALAVGVALVVSIVLPTQPSRVDLQISNPTDYDLTVYATDEGRDGWDTLGTVERGVTTTMQDAFDRGDVWVLRFRGQGVDGGELRIPRSTFEDDGWSFEVPTAIGDRLRGQGAHPSPP